MCETEGMWTEERRVRESEREKCTRAAARVRGWAWIHCAPDSTEQLTQGLPHAAAPAQTGKPYRLPKGEKTTPHENENKERVLTPVPEARRHWNEVFQVQRKDDFQTGASYPAEL